MTTNLTFDEIRTLARLKVADTWSAFIDDEEMKRIIVDAMPAMAKLSARQRLTQQ